MKVSIGVRLGLLSLLMAAPAHAAGFYVTVAGHIGEPDYEQRFTTPAKDLDKLLKATGADAHVFTLIGADATRARLTQVLEQVAREAKADDDFVLTLIGHGSYDSVEYKFNLVGRDMSAAEIAALCNRIAARRQLVVNATSASGSFPFPRAGRAVVTSPNGAEKTPPCSSAAGQPAEIRPPTWTRTDRSARSSLPMRRPEDRRVTRRRSALRPNAVLDTGKGPVPPPPQLR
jgi:hypothetical protein